ncbi:MAG: hypothetical protein WC761_05015 [Candidatus Paceibacterota bacterium]|jgi:hypothetical protein
MTIHGFPGGEEIKPEEKVLEGGPPSEPDAAKIPTPFSSSEFNKNFLNAKVMEVLDDPRLREMPTNILGIENGTILDINTVLPELDLVGGEGSFTPVFFDGFSVRIGNLDGKAIPLETLIGLINAKKLSIERSIENPFK